MKTSDAIDKIAAAVFLVQKDMQPIKRDKVVKTGKYEFRYAPLDSIMTMLRPLLDKAELTVIQGLDAEVLTTRLMHTSGQWIQSETHLNRDHVNMQGFGSEATYKRRYALSALLGIVADEDNDAPIISPTKGAMQALSQRQQNRLQDLADYITEKVKEDNEYGAYEEYVQITDQEERIAIWSVLDSKTRSTLTRLNKQEREGSKQ